MKIEDIKSKAVMILTRHVGRSQAINMGDLYQEIYGAPWRNRHHDTRRIRTAIRELRNEGVPVISSTSPTSPGYWLASAGTELDEYCSRFKAEALKKLGIVAKLRRKAMPELLGQLQMELGEVTHG